MIAGSSNTSSAMIGVASPAAPAARSVTSGILSPRR
jgi:hypothetical protein